MGRDKGVAKSCVERGEASVVEGVIIAPLGTLQAEVYRCGAGLSEMKYRGAA
jgi:hypothetical protein